MHIWHAAFAGNLCCVAAAAGVTAAAWSFYMLGGSTQASHDFGRALDLLALSNLQPDDVYANIGITCLTFPTTGSAVILL